MIVPMKKMHLITLEHDREITVHRLGLLGVVHVDSSGPAPQSDTLQALRDRRRLIQEAIAELGQVQHHPRATHPDVDAPASGERAIEYAREILAKVDEIRLANDRIDELRAQEQSLAPWGELDPEDVRFLRNNGVDVHMYVGSHEVLSRIPEDTDYIVVWKDRTRRGVLTFAPLVLESGSSVDELHMPEASRARLQSAIDEHSQELQRKLAELAAMHSRIPVLIAGRDEVDGYIEYESVAASMRAEGELLVLTGYVPEETSQQLIETAKSEGWALLIEDPGEEDPVPTRLRNPRAVRIVEPTYDFLSAYPGYRERDLSFWFLSFFMVFFGMIIGDAGYGALLVLGIGASAVSRARAGKGVADAQILLGVSSFAAVVWGAMTGNWFGVEAIPDNTFLGALVVPALDSFEAVSLDNVMYVSFTLGALHLVVAHAWNFLEEVRQKPMIRSFAQIGWVVFLLGMHGLVIQMILGGQGFFFVPGTLPLLITGMVMVALFAQQEGNFIKGVLSTLSVANIIPTILNFIGGFSDIMSYIRLFAVGLASIEIAKAFNYIAGLFPEGPFVVAAILVLGLGHALNIAMAALSVIVHGIRLNMLEFSGHLGVEWAGVAYRPFRTTDEQRNA